MFYADLVRRFWLDSLNITTVIVVVAGVNQD